MDERLRFIVRLLEGEKMAPLCCSTTGRWSCGTLRTRAPTSRPARLLAHPVREAPERRGWTQERRLAEGSGLDRTYIGGVERGETNLALLNINSLAVALGDGFAGLLPYRAARRRP